MKSSPKKLPTLLWIFLVPCYTRADYIELDLHATKRKLVVKCMRHLEYLRLRHKIIEDIFFQEIHRTGMRKVETKPQIQLPPAPMPFWCYLEPVKPVVGKILAPVVIPLIGLVFDLDKL